MTKYFLFDCITGGRPEKHASLLTVHGMILDPHLQKQDVIDLKIKPNSGVYSIEPRAMHSNKIDLLKHDADAINETEAATLFVDFICRCNVSSTGIIPVGHNVAFDISFMKKLIGASTWRQQFSKKVIDVASIAEFFCLTQSLPASNKVDCSLKGLAKRFDIPYARISDAEGDAKLTLQILKHLMTLERKEKIT